MSPTKFDKYKKHPVRDEWYYVGTFDENTVVNPYQYKSLPVEKLEYKIWEDKWLHVAICALLIGMMIILN